MAFEKKGTGAQEQAENPEIKAEAEALGKKAEQVAEQLDGAEVSELTQAELDRLDARMDRVVSTLIALGGAALIAGTMLAEHYGLLGSVAPETAGRAEYLASTFSGLMLGVVGFQKMINSWARFAGAVEKIGTLKSKK